DRNVTGVQTCALPISSVRGGSSISDKADSHFILKKAKEKDLEKVSGIIEEQGFGNKPNYMKILFKNRSGRPDVIIWSYLDYSTRSEERRVGKECRSTR